MKQLGMAALLGLAWTGIGPAGAARAQTVLSLSATGAAVTVPKEMEADYNVFRTQAPAYQASRTLNLAIAAPGGVPPRAFTRQRPAR